MPSNLSVTPVTTLRPGLLVSLKTSIKGNVSYVKRDLEAEQVSNGAAKAKWETERTIVDPVEHEAATQVRSKARSLVTSVCIASQFGLLCPQTAAEDLDRAVTEANALCNDFNKTAKVSRVYLYIIAGKVADTEIEAVKAINSEVRDLLADMTDGLQKLDVKAVRAAASKAKQIGGMLTVDAQARIQIAIDAARTAATKIVAAGEQAAVEIDRRTIAALTEARTAFLDIDQPDREIAAPVTAGRSLDLTPETDTKTTEAAPAGSARQIELA